MATKKTSTSKPSAKKEEKFSLMDLIYQSDVPYFKIIIALSREGLLGQLEEEKRQTRTGEPIEPKLTSSEFKKIVEE